MSISNIDEKVKKDNTTTENNKQRIKNTIVRYLNGYYRYKLLKVGRIPSHHVRNVLYKIVFKVKMDSNSVLYGGAEIRSPNNLHIGEGAIIGDNSILDARHGIIIGEHVNFSSNVSLWTLQHDYNDPNFSTEGQGGSIIIEKRAWLGPNVTVLPGIKIGEGAVVGAGSVVTKDLEPFKLYGGIPAHIIGDRNKNLIYKFKGKYLPFY
ncbi:acyltransferase [Labilibacter sediminis]|nr:acyltransferase [Labilibacter sediminis]